jgi:hypothetical protein
MSDPKRMLTDPELGELLRADLDASAKRTFDYDVETGVARHLALIAGGAAAATATATATATASTTATATTAATATATTAATATGVAAGIGVKTMIAVAAIGVASATGGVIAVTRGSPAPEPKPAAVTAIQPSPSPPRAKADWQSVPAADMPVLEPTPTITPDDLPLAKTDVAPATVSSKAEMDNYAQARTLAPADPTGALALLEDGTKRFPLGVFAEEREALAIDCLSRTGRTAEAKQRAQTFLSAHPTSTFAEKIRQQTDSR